MEPPKKLRKTRWGPLVGSSSASKAPVILPTKYATLKVNQNLTGGVTGPAAPKPALYTQNAKSVLKALRDRTLNPYYDSSLRTSSDKLRKQGLRFVEKGYWLKRQEELADQGVETNEQQQAVGPRLAVPLQRDRTDAMPEMEPWDLPLVEKVPAISHAKSTGSASRTTRWGSLKEAGSSSESITIPESQTVGMSGPAPFPYVIKEALITALIEHPVPVEPLGGATVPKAQVCSFLTERERRKMRRRNKQEKEQTKRDKIRMGLIPPDPPKAKLSNLMRVLKDQAVAKPTAVDAKIRQEVKDRLEAHERRNADRKLSKAERSEKTKNKWIQKEETQVQVTVAIMTLPQDQVDRQQIFKLHRTAQNLHLTGVAALCPGHVNLVIVEGASRAIKRYKGLMLRRIKWSASEEAEGEEEVVGKDGCRILWEGCVHERAFKTWRLLHAVEEAEILSYLQDHKAETYWGILKRHREKAVDLITS